MVQLKGGPCGPVAPSKPISIPYGSIKRKRAQCNSPPIHSISIPYGSIKRICAGEYKEEFWKFQFLMVQLKVTGIYANPILRGFQFLMVQLKVAFLYFAESIASLISIPYGSIKSVSEEQPTTSNIKFQFLMVQLKV